MAENGIPTEAWRSGSGVPLVLLHGITGTWEMWTPVLDALAARHDVLAITLPGHHGGAPVPAGVAVGVDKLADMLEERLDAHGIERAHIAGNSLGGLLALELGHRGRALSVVALSPAGAWLRPRDFERVVRAISLSTRLLERHGPRVATWLRRPRLRRLALRQTMEHGHRMPGTALPGLLAGVVASGPLLPGFFDEVRAGGSLRTRALDVPLLIAWSERDRVLPFKRYGRPFVDACTGAEHVTLRGVGHVPMYDDPELVVRTILDFTSRATSDNHGSTGMTASTSTDIEIEGRQGPLVVRRWAPEEPVFAVLLAHGYGEHSGRYEHVAQRLVAEGAVVYAPDHAGHGRSGGERTLIHDMDDLAADLGTVAERVRADHPDLPLTLIGHSLGGLIATRLLQTTDAPPVALVLSAPFIGGNPEMEPLLALDPIPEVPIDPDVLSRDPSVGEAYAADPLVYHGPFLKPTLEATFAAVGAVAAGRDAGGIPVLWVHGAEDALAPLAVTRPVVERLAGERLEAHVYPGARHEVFNETNRDEVLDAVAAFLRASVLSDRGVG